MQVLPDDGEDRAPYKMIQTIGLSVGAAVAYIIVVLGLMFYCKKRRNAKRLQKGQDGEEPEMECLNGLNLLTYYCGVSCLGYLLPSCVLSG